MNQMMKKWLAAAMALMMTLALAGCTLVDSTEKVDSAEATEAPAAATAAEYTEEERALVAARIGEYTITKGDVIDEYNTMLSFYSSYGYSVPTADEDIETMQDTVLSGLVSEKVMMYQAEQMGIYPFDEANAAVVEQAYTDEMQELMDTYQSYATDEGYDNIEEGAVELINKALAENNWNMDLEGYKTWLREQIEYEKVVELLEAKVTEAVVPSEEDVQAYYDELVKTQGEQYAASPLDYLSAAETYEMDGGTPILVAPEGYLRVKVIGMQPETEIDVSYDEKLDKMDELEAEYGHLALSDAANSKARLAEIQAEYAMLSAEKDTLYAAHTMQARAKAQEALSKLKGGAAFDEVLKEYGDDEAYTLYETIAAKGRLMMPGNEDGWDSELHDAAQSLKDGEYSDVIEVDGVFYILQRIGEEQAGTLTLDEVRQIIEPLASEEAATAAWSAKQEEWLADTSIVTYYEDVYRDVGKAAS